MPPRRSRRNRPCSGTTSWEAEWLRAVLRGGYAASHSLGPFTLPADVELDRIPALLGEIERLRVVVWARLSLEAGVVSSPLTIKDLVEMAA